MSTEIPTPGEGASVTGQDTAEDTVTVRRAPKIWRFAIVGAIVGMIVALIGTFAFPNNPQQTGFTNEQIFGFLLVIGIVLFGGLALVIVLIVDATSRRRAKTVRVAHVVEIDPEDGAELAAAEAAAAGPSADAADAPEIAPVADASPSDGSAAAPADGTLPAEPAQPSAPDSSQTPPERQ